MPPTLLEGPAPCEFHTHTFFSYFLPRRALNFPFFSNAIDCFSAAWQWWKKKTHNALLPKQYPGVPQWARDPSSPLCNIARARQAGNKVRAALVRS